MYYSLFAKENAVDFHSQIDERVDCTNRCKYPNYLQGNVVYKGYKVYKIIGVMPFASDSYIHLRLCRGNGDKAEI